MKKNIRSGVFLPGLFLLFICVIMMKEQTIVRKAVSESLALCAYTVIPSLFPFTVLSLLLTTSNVFASSLFRPFRPLTNLLRLPQNAIGALLSGFLCGFPLGAASVAEMYEKGELNRQQANRLLALANNTSPAFVVSLAGSVLFNDPAFGIFLYAMQIFTALLIGIIIAGISKDEPPLLSIPPFQNQKSPVRFAGSVTRAAGSMLSVCAMIVLFRVFADIITVSIPFLNTPLTETFITAVLECTAGVTNAAALGGKLGGAMAGFSIGWSGISVLLQCQFFTEETDLSMKLCVISKFFQGLLLALGSVLFLFLRGKGLNSLATSIEIDYRLLTAVEIALLGLVVFLGAIICRFFERRENKKSS